VSSTVHHALAAARGDGAGPAPPVFDGRGRQVVSRAGRAVRAQLSRPALRAALRALRTRRPE
jgi:hypothetical protein